MKRGIIVIIMLCGTLAYADIADDEKLARRLIVTQGCRACHQLDGSGGKVGPSLDKVGDRLSPYRIEQKLLYPGSFVPGSRMPDAKHLLPDEVKALSRFLGTRK